MRKLSQTNWLFLGYLALLFNLGPSLHHVEFFGLHCQDAGCCKAPFSQNVSSCCCEHAGHSHGHHHDGDHSTESSSDCIKVGISAINQACDLSCEDCAFCKFFDQFNVVSETFDFVLSQSPVCSIIASPQGAAFSEFVPESARGPPEFFSAEMVA